MRPNTTQMVHHVDVIDDSLRMSIDNDSIKHLMTLLTDLYSDPVLAVVREYSTNARDSHIDAKVVRPIEVTLPSALNPTFKVQDFGVGLNVDDLRDVYSMYGKSTKRNSDEATGTLGLGCKSGLTYTLSFTVDAVKDGVRTVAAVTKDEEGVGVIKILDTVSTSEANGVTVSIPVKSYDIEKFQAAANKLFPYWRGGVLVDGKAPELPEEFTSSGIWVDDDILVIPKTHASKVVMGGIPYHFDCGISGTSIIAWIPMGSVNFTPAREALHLTKLTNSTLQTVKEFAQERLTAAIMQAIEDAKTPFDQLTFSMKWWFYTRTLKTHWTSTEYLNISRPAWRVQSGGQSVGTASRRDSVSLASLVQEETLFVTDYPNKAISGAHKLRLGEWMVKTGTKAKTSLFLPDGSDLKYLRGAPLRVKWEKIVDATQKPKLPRGSGPRMTTEYVVRYNGTNYTTTQITETDAPIVFATPHNGSYFLSLFPEARCVEIKSAQVDRFCRLHPTAVWSDQYHEKVTKRARDTLMEEDLIYSHADRSVMLKLDPVLHRLSDPDLEKVISACRKPSDRLNKASRFVTTSTIPESKTLKRVYARYPLLLRVSWGWGSNAVIADAELMNDLIEYINHKYESNKEDT